MQQFQTALVAQIDAQALLAHVLLQEVAAGARLQNCGMSAARIAFGRPLHLDHLGAQRGKRAGQKRPG